MGKLDFAGWLKANGWKESKNLIGFYENKTSTKRTDDLVIDWKLEVFPDIFPPKPDAKLYGYESADHFTGESGWVIEGGKEAYFEALRAWEIKIQQHS